jgi:hypothetical protein
MVEIKMKVKLQRKSRAHRILFDSDLPFKPKREQPKNQFRRKPKHFKDLTNE